jgi:hypothetical protein
MDDANKSRPSFRNASYGKLFSHHLSFLLLSWLHKEITQFHGLPSLKTITGIFLIENEASKLASKKIID